MLSRREVRKVENSKELQTALMYGFCLNLVLTNQFFFMFLFAVSYTKSMIEAAAAESSKRASNIPAHRLSGIFCPPTSSGKRSSTVVYVMLIAEQFLFSVEKRS